MMTYITVKHPENDYSIPTTSTPNHHAKRIDAMSVPQFNLNTNEKLTPVGKEYMCFQIDGKSSQSEKCVQSRIITQVIDCALSIDTYEKQYDVLKVMSPSPRLKYTMNNIGIDQSLRNSALFNRRCLQNIKKLCKHAGKCDTQQQFKDIIEATMVSAT